MITKYLFVASMGLASLFSACQSAAPTHDGGSLDSTALQAISEESYKANVAQLASDEFLGRKPFTKGDTLAVNFIADRFKELGLQPANADSYFQEVPMVEVTSKPKNKTLNFQGPQGSINLNYLDDFVIGSRKLETEITIPTTELVFAGFGIVAPEYKWNDYAGLDVKGKTVVVLASDPGHYDKNLFKADTMTYYGRWTYKYEEAARQGATGVLIIHDTKAASYGWDVIRSGWTGPQLDLANNAEPKTAFEGWLSADAARALFKIAAPGTNLVEQALKPGFKAVPMQVSTTITLQNNLRYATSNNVVAKIEGSKRPEEVIIYTAHWDHLGVGEPVNGDSIYNGAVDNAAGVAALFEIAKAFKAAKVKPERTVLFIALTGEEEGLLGSAYYTDNPLFPLRKTVANINMDAFNPTGETKDVSVIGYGQSEMDNYVEHSAAKFGRIVQGEKNPSSGGFYRSDHFNFVKKGVPGLFMGSGNTYISTDTLALNLRKEALKGRYHAPSDELDAHWDFNGILADIRLFFDIGYTLSREKTFPQFKEKSEFRELGLKRLTK
ncbi:M28 family metallopeptidase [Sphingobacterium sp. Mn56C]|uniref:M28 family metallopeptidase n=1 Tax=Sphingobacterium sp. Mn56C TaxID=3395261 RepID=UPI003BEDA1E7